MGEGEDPSSPSSLGIYIVSLCGKYHEEQLCEYSVASFFIPYCDGDSIYMYCA